MKVFSKERLFKALRVGEIIRGIHVGEDKKSVGILSFGECQHLQKKKEPRRF